MRLESRRKQSLLYVARIASPCPCLIDRRGARSRSMPLLHESSPSPPHTKHPLAREQYQPHANPSSRRVRPLTRLDPSPSASPCPLAHLSICPHPNPPTPSGVTPYSKQLIQRHRNWLSRLRHHVGGSRNSIRWAWSMTFEDLMRFPRRSWVTMICLRSCCRVPSLLPSLSPSPSFESFIRREGGADDSYRDV